MAEQCSAIVGDGKRKITESPEQGRMNVRLAKLVNDIQQQ
jgi:hypothetical protein